MRHWNPREDYWNDSVGGDMARWRDGVGLPILVTLWGLFDVATGQIGIGFEVQGLKGPSQRALGLVILAFGVLMHSERFWATDRNLAQRVWMPRVAAGVLFLAGLGWLVGSVLR